MKKILILHTSVGLGHKFIAENIGKQLAAAGYEVAVRDILQVQQGKLVEVSTKIHRWINLRTPWLWSWLYHFTNLAWVSDLTLPVRLRVAAKNCAKTQELITEYSPDAIISVQNVPSAVVSHLKSSGKYRGLFGIGFSDFHLHKFWLFKNADFYLANTQEQKQEMLSLGYAPEKIFVCGMTLQDKPQIDARAVRRKLGLLPDSRVVLMGSGSLGTGFEEALISQAAGIQVAEVLVVCGKNHGYQKYLEARLPQNNVKVLGFYSPMAELYAIADIYVGKPGGLTTSEALFWNLPLLVTHWLPGQEELNIRYLKQKQLVILAKDVAAQIKQEIMAGAFKKQLQNNLFVDSLVRPEVTALKAVSAVLHRFD